MHEITIWPFIEEQAKAQRQGSLGPRSFDPKKTAHLVVDMQNGFLKPGGAVEVPMARAIVGNVNKVSRAVRAAGGVNVFLRFVYNPDETRPWTNWYHSLCNPESSADRREAFLSHAPDSMLWPELDCQPADWVLEKTRFSAFIPNTCDLEQRLQEAGIETVIISGTLTNCCSEACARDAHQLGYNVIFMTDANAALTDAEHNATLNNLYVNFADLASTEQIVALLAKNN
ncbi:MAG TPA: cysteine hydrolase [Paenalcaligenes hominis]|uniref:Cysteine hydrolase n=1 Tax=Paenalcaligenes hominis TaxID=643674 RepID=A0A9D2VFV2_9BURK|nr:cysteine hydrolase [Paenalcaligenes hominis]